jgi:HK97 family phage portal protein
MGLFRRSENRAPVEVVEQRDPSAATKSLRWVNPSQAQPPDWSAEQAFRIAYYMSVVVFACTRLHANTLSSLPFRVGADPGKPKDFDPNAPLARLLGPPPGGPAPKLSARRLWAWTTAQRIVTGRNGWEIETAPGSDVPVALWPLPSSHLTPVPTTSGVEWFSAFEFGRPGDKRRLRADRVAYDWDPRGDDFRQPESALEAAGLSIAVEVMQAKYDYAFLRNDARPAAIVVTEEFEDEDSYRAFKDQWNGQHGGPDNAGRMAFVEAAGGGDRGVVGAVDVKVLGFSPKDAQAAQRHAAAMEHTAMALGTPWSLLDASGRTFSNAGQEWSNWVHTRLLPLIRDFQDMVNMQLAPLFGPNVGWFDLSSLGIDEAVEPQTAKVGAPSMVQAQLMTIDEARADYGLGPLPDGQGDRLMTVEEIQALRGNLAGEGDGARSVIKAEVREVTPPSSPLEDPDPPAPSEPEDRGETAEEAEARRSKIWAANDSTVRNLERAWEKAIVRLFKRQERSVLARLDAKRGRQQYARAIQGEVRALADEVFDPQHWIVETVDDARVLYEQVTATAGAAMASRFGLAFDLDAAHVAEFIEARANQLAGLVTETTYTQIQDALVEGITEGEAIPDLAARIRHVFEVASKSRAVTIARTEVISAYNGAGTAVAAAYGPDVVGGREWVATRDSRTRDTHAARDGEVVTMTETFSGGLAYPGDPSAPAGETVNCRCTVAYLTPDEMHERAARSVKVDVARAVIALVRPGEFDELWVRSALRRAA